MTASAVAIGRLSPTGPWVGFARATDGRYALVVDGIGVDATGDELVELAIAYFEDALADPPEELAATHADIGDLLRALAGSEADPRRRRALADALDAIDDGLAADVVVSRLEACLSEAGEGDAVARLVRRATEVLAGRD